MSLLALLSAPPLAAPYNAPAPLALQTYDGSGATIHPSAVDMGVGGWRGHRYWLADTPYAGGDAQLENPSVWTGPTPSAFTVPAGVANPLVAPLGPSVGFHSDTELVYDPDGDRMVMYYRRYLYQPQPIVYLDALTTADGVTWAPHSAILDLPYAPSDDQYAAPKREYLSPSVVRSAPGVWHLWLWGGWRDTAVRYEAASPLGPWSSPSGVTLDGVNLHGWHGDVILHAGRYYMAYSDNLHSQALGASSLDGLAWASSPEPLLTKRDGEWDHTIYRPTLSPGPESGVISMWYSAISDPSPGGFAVGFTRLPISAWG